MHKDETTLYTIWQVLKQGKLALCAQALLHCFQEPWSSEWRAGPLPWSNQFWLELAVGLNMGLCMCCILSGGALARKWCISESLRACLDSHA